MIKLKKILGESEASFVSLLLYYDSSHWMADWLRRPDLSLSKQYVCLGGITPRPPITNTSLTSAFLPPSSILSYFFTVFCFVPSSLILLFVSIFHGPIIGGVCRGTPGPYIFFHSFISCFSPLCSSVLFFLSIFLFKPSMGNNTDGIHVASSHGDCIVATQGNWTMMSDSQLPRGLLTVKTHSK